MEEYTQPLQALGPAKTPNELRVMMIRNNNARGKRYHYLNPVFVKGEGWYSWYELKFENKVEPNANK